MNWESLDHVGHAVAEMESALRFYTSVLGFTVELRETLAESKVEVAFLKLDNTSIELVAPLAGNTVLKKYLDTNGEGLHHVCYRVPSVAAELERLRELGIVLIDEIPRKGARGSEIAFLHPKSMLGVLVELCSYK